MWFVYILKCNDETLYTGVTNDLARRVDEHNFLSVGAKYTRARRPVELVYSRKFRSRSRAQQEEYRIKKLNRGEKMKLLWVQ